MCAGVVQIRHMCVLYNCAYYIGLFFRVGKEATCYEAGNYIDWNQNLFSLVFRLKKFTTSIFKYSWCLLYGHVTYIH